MNPPVVIGQPTVSSKNNTDHTEGGSKHKNSSSTSSTSSTKYTFGLTETMKRARLRLVKGGNSKQLWVHRATSMMPGAPKSKYVRKLIIDAWETGSLAGYHKHIIHRPLADHQMVAFKAIVVWMKLLQQGPPDVLGGDAESAMTIIETMQINWAR